MQQGPSARANGTASCGADANNPAVAARLIRCTTPARQNSHSERRVSLDLLARRLFDVSCARLTAVPVQRVLVKGSGRRASRCIAVVRCRASCAQSYRHRPGISLETGVGPFRDPHRAGGSASKLRPTRVSSAVAAEVAKAGGQGAGGPQGSAGRFDDEVPAPGRAGLPTGPPAPQEVPVRVTWVGRRVPLKARPAPWAWQPAAARPRKDGELDAPLQP